MEHCVELLRFFFVESGAEQTDFLVSLNTFYKSFEADAAAFGINKITIPRRPVAITSVFVRLFGPTVICPPEVAIVVAGGGMQSEICRFGRWREGEGVRTLGIAASVEVGLLSFCSTASQGFLVEKVVLETYADVVHSVGCLAVNAVVCCSFDLELGICILNCLPCCFHLVFRTFVHSDIGPFEPSLLTKVTAEIFKERHDEIVVFCFSGTAVEVFDTVRCTVVIVETIVPWNECIAVYLFGDATRHHELHPAVEDGVVVFPCAIDLFHLGNHAFEVVEGLSVPGAIDDGAGDNFLSGSSQHLHDGAHFVEVLTAPERYVKVACHSIRVLPEVEMERPLAWFRQHAVCHLQHDGQGEFLAIAVHGDCAFICAGYGLRRHLYVEPQR